MFVPDHTNKNQFIYSSGHWRNIFSLHRSKDVSYKNIKYLVVAFASSEITLVLVANLEATTCMSTEISEMVADLLIVMGVL